MPEKKLSWEEERMQRYYDLACRLVHTGLIRHWDERLRLLEEAKA